MIDCRMRPLVMRKRSLSALPIWVVPRTAVAAPVTWQKARRVRGVFIRRECQPRHSESINPKLMKYRKRIRLLNQFRIQLEEEIQTPIRFGIIDRARHQDVRGVMITFGFNQAAIELREFGIALRQRLGEQLKFLATAPFDQRAAN